MQVEADRWLTVKGAAAHVQVSPALIYRAVQQGHLRAVRLGVRKDIRILLSWVDAWATSLMVGTLVNPEAPGQDVPPELAALPFTRRGRKV